MPLAPAPAIPVPQYWTIFAHSYFQLAFGTRTSQGRADGFMSRLLYIQQGLNIQNHAAPGVRLCVQGDAGFGRVLQLIKGWTGGAGNLGNTAPYVVGGAGGAGSAFLLGYGINDLGFNGNTVQFNTAYQHAMRTVISRCRMSTLGTTGANNYPGGTGTFAMSGWAANAVAMGGGYCTGTGNLFTTTIGNTITLTLPADYTGQTVALCFLSQPGGTGNTITFSGTAGVSGTINTSNIQPSGSLTYTPVLKRITNLTAANAGQTIIITVTAIDANFAYFDSWWLEADNPPPVVVANTARLCDNPLGGAGTSGYLTAGYFGGMGDSDVVTFNTYLNSVVAEFDSMVQIADIDSALNKSNALFCYDGLHPNEVGSARMGQSILSAVQRMVPTSKWGSAVNMNPPGPVITPLSRPYVTGQFYTSDCFGGATSSQATVAGDVWALPLFVTNGVAQWTNWVMEMIATTSAAPTVFMAVYDDRQMTGYPQWMHVQPSNSSALTLLAAPGVFTSTNTAGNNGYLSQMMDPGLYWMVVKIVTAGTCNLRACKGPSLWVPNLTSAGAGGTTPCGWKLSGQGAGAMAGRFPSGATAVDSVPMIGIKTLLAQ
jgi:hypothetical protein